VAVLELGECQGRVGEVADSVRAGGDVLRLPPAADQEREAAFASAA